MSSMKPDLFLGRAPNGDPKAQNFRWPSKSDCELKWENLTNEDIIVLVNSSIIHCVVLQDKEDGAKTGGVSQAEFYKISELFVDFDTLYRTHGKPFKVFYYHGTGKYSSVERVETISKRLVSHTNHRIEEYGWEVDGHYYSEVTAEVPAGYSHFVQASYWCTVDLGGPPKVHVALAKASMDGSNVDTGDSHE